jgi:hypothetical protein
MGVKDNHCRCCGKNHLCSLFVIGLVDVGVVLRAVENAKTRTPLWNKAARFTSSQLSLYLHLRVCKFVLRCYRYPIAATRSSPPVQSISQQTHIYLLKDVMMQSNHKVESLYFIWQLSAVTTSYCTRLPYVRSVPCLAQYSRWDSLEICVWGGGMSFCWLHLNFYFLTAVLFMESS